MERPSPPPEDPHEFLGGLFGGLELDHLRPRSRRRELELRGPGGSRRACERFEGNLGDRQTFAISGWPGAWRSEGRSRPAATKRCTEAGPPTSLPRLRARVGSGAGSCRVPPEVQHRAEIRKAQRFGQGRADDSRPRRPPPACRTARGHAGRRRRLGRGPGPLSADRETAPGAVSTHVAWSQPRASDARRTSSVLGAGPADTT